MKSFFRAMLDCKAKIYDKRDRPSADIYSTVEKFLLEGNYSSYKNANTLAELKLKGYSDGIVASQLNISDATVRVHVRNVSNELYKLFGASFPEQLADYKNNTSAVNAVMYRLKFLNRKSTSYIMPDVVSLIKDSTGGHREYDLNDCSQELDFLKRYSFDFLRGAVGNVDLEKLRYLVDVMDGVSGSSEDWSFVVSSIQEG